MKITPTHRRLALLAVVAIAAFGGGGAVGALTAQPEVITISEDVPPSCGDAARQANAALKAWGNLDQYETKAEVMAADLTLVTLAGDASLIEDALAPIAKHNEKENEWRLKRDSAQDAFETAADECLAKAAAAEAANGR